jgi:hypothetical protein
MGCLAGWRRIGLNSWHILRSLPPPLRERGDLPVLVRRSLRRFSREPEVLARWKTPTWRLSSASAWPSTTATRTRGRTDALANAPTSGKRLARRLRGQF